MDTVQQLFLFVLLLTPLNYGYHTNWGSDPEGLALREGRSTRKGAAVRAPKVEYTACLSPAVARTTWVQVTS